MQVLNIDAYASPKRELQHKGVSYAIKEVDLQSFIDNLVSAEKLAAAAKAGVGIEALQAQIRASVNIVCENIPDLPREVAESWNVNQLGKVLEFIRGELDDTATTGQGDATGEKKAT